MSPNEIIESTKQLVAIPSTLDNLPALQKAVSFIADMLEDIPGITTERFESAGKPSLLAYAGSKRPDKFAVALHGHVDVVPGNADQFSAYEKNGRLYGRGVHDMKTAAIIMADIFRRTALFLPFALGLIIVSDEEDGGAAGTLHIAQNGFRTDFAVTGENNFQNNVIYNASRGICWVEVEFRGRTAHGAYVWHGENALDKAVCFSQAVLQKYPKPNTEQWCTTANIANIYSPNTTYNRIPDFASVRIDFRFTEVDPVFANRRSVKAFISSIDPDAVVSEIRTMEPAVHVPEDNIYLQVLAAALRETIGEPVLFKNRPATSDGRHLSPFGMNVVEYGIVGSGHHSDHEYIEISSIPEYLKALETFLTSSALAETIIRKGHSLRPARPHGRKNR